jgi:hypothetical protein
MFPRISAPSYQILISISYAYQKSEFEHLDSNMLQILNVQIQMRTIHVGL